MVHARLVSILPVALGLLAAQDNQVITLPAPPATAGTSTSSSYAVRESAAAQTPPVAGRPVGLLWKATSGTNTVYLAGSIHFGSPDMYPLPQAMESAFDKSSVLVVEIDTTAVNPMSVMGVLARSGSYSGGDSLMNHLSERTRSRFPAFAASLGLPAEMLYRLKPWAVGFMISAQMMQAAGMRTDLGIDMHFLGQAKGSKRIEELETLDEQIQALITSPEREQILDLEQTVADPERSKQLLRTMKAAWLKGDAATIDGLISEEFSKTPETRRRLLDDRNVRMATAVERYLRGSEPCFVVVGAGHLVGKSGIPSRLAQKGFKVSQVVAAN